MGMFDRIFKRAKRDPGNAGFDENPGTYRAVWEQKRLPDPGAQNFAWETLGLFQLAPSGPTVTNRDAIVPLSTPMYAYQSGMLLGTPLTAGQIVGQPLYDPNSGYTNTLSYGRFDQAPNDANPRQAL